jgi:hypothetical protein
VDADHLADGDHEPLAPPAASSSATSSVVEVAFIGSA